MFEVARAGSPRPGDHLHRPEVSFFAHRSGGAPRRTPATRPPHRAPWTTGLITRPLSVPGRALGRTVRPLARTLVVLLIACAPLLFLTTPARAHNVLIGSDPQDGARLSAMPARVTLTFDQAVRRDFARIAVTGPDGAHYEQGDVGVSGDSVFIGVRGPGVSGEYTIGYRIVSNDGHPVTGTIGFTVTGGAGGQGGTGPAPDSKPGTTAAIGKPTSLEVPGSSGGWVWVLLIFTAALLALAALVLVRHDRRALAYAGDSPHNRRTGTAEKTDAGQSGPAQADAGRTEAGRRDAGQRDAGQTDAGQTDAGQTDAGQTDAGQTDAGQTDSADAAGHGDAGRAGRSSGEPGLGSGA
ncbi:copper resistance protein CopC [Planotetraspora sp. GP83]|uniref:copper resistance CopC family protein n=1 Tax=Planotetraspora sp. GP83 TaxID=3156264 RepID=UPI003515F47D